MDAFYYANYNVQQFDSVSTPGNHLVGQLELGPGSYVVFATANIATNVQSGPPSPDGAAAVLLTLAGKNDTADVVFKPESGENWETVSLMVAAKMDTTEKARLYVQALTSLKTDVLSVRLVALQVDRLTITEDGTDSTVPPSE